MTDTIVHLIPITSITIKDRQRKHTHTDEEIDSLAESIRITGLIHPIRIDENNVLIVGEGRIKAHLRLGRTVIPAIYGTDMDDWQKEVMELEENIRRYDLDYRDRLSEELRLHQMYVEKHGKKATLSGRAVQDNWRLEDTAALLGISIGAACQRLELAKALEKDPALATGRTETQALHEMKRQKELQNRKVMAILTVAAKPKPDIADAVANQLQTPTLESFSHDLATLYNASCLDVIPTLPDDSIACLLTDPPWQVKFDTRFGSDPDTGLQLTKEMLLLLKPKLQQGALCWLFCASAHLIPGAIYNLVKDCGYTPSRHILIWTKPKTATCSWPYKEIKPDYEPCLLFSNGPARDFTAPLFALQEAKVPQGDKVHPAQKPAEVLETIILTSTVPGELIIDPFVGSGAVLKASNQLKRRSVGIEKEPDWYATGIVHLTQETQQCA